MIGVFDSGLGGLTVLKQLKKKLPQYDYLYFGDTLHVPYGNRSEEAVFELTRQACDYLFKQGCKLIIIACNTASAKALRRIQQEYLPTLPDKQLRVLGVIRPIVEFMAQNAKQKVGIIGTRGTVQSGAYVVELKKLQPKLRVEQVSAPLLVPLIEENWLKRPETAGILEYYLKPLKREKVDSLILGCTHYPLLIKQVREIMGEKCEVPDPGEIVAGSLVEYLNRHPEMAERISPRGERIYQVSDLNENFAKIAEKFLGEKITVKKIIKYS